MRQNGYRKMNKNDTVEVQITDYTQEGLGIGHADEMAIFIKDTVIGDVVSARITKVKKTYAYGRVLQVLTKSPDRVKPPCPVAGPCGGCQIQMMAYEAQLRYKQEKVKNCLVRLGGFDRRLIDEVMAEDIIGMDKPYRFRNKSQYPIGRDKTGQLIAGFYAGRTHSIIDCGDYLIGPKENRQILQIILRHMESCGIDPYDEESLTGLIRHVMIRKAFATGRIMVVLVLNGKDLPRADLLVAALTACKDADIECIALNCNTKRTNVILGEETKILKGQGFLEDRIGDVRFRIGVRSFYQVNPVQTEKLYETALQFAGLTGTETVWDLYCGIGTISLFLARHAAFVYGVEIIPEAVENARENARINGITNAAFFTGRAEEVLPEQYGKGLSHADVIVVDPPRKGCDQVLLDTMLAMAPERIVYVSCDPATLSRDLKILCAGTYELRQVQAVDQFCHSCHVEVVSLLQRMSNTLKKTITLDVDMEDYHRIKSEGR